MKNPAIHIKKKLFSLLNGNMTYNGAAVPVYEGEGKFGLPAQVLIKEYSDTDRRNKDAFKYTATQVIEVVTERNDDASKDADAVSELVMDILQPAPKANLLNGTDFQAFIIGTPSKNLLRESGSGTTVITRRILRYNLLINEI